MFEVFWLFVTKKASRKRLFCSSLFRYSKLNSSPKQILTYIFQFKAIKGFTALNFCRIFVELLTFKMELLANMVKWLQCRELTSVKNPIFPIKSYEIRLLWTSRHVNLEFFAQYMVLYIFKSKEYREHVSLIGMSWISWRYYFCVWIYPLNITWRLCIEFWPHFLLLL